MTDDWDAELWPKLRGSGCLWHSTTVAGSGGIIGSGEITSNTGQFPVSFRQSLYSWSRHLGGVSLGYFDDATDGEISQHEWDYNFLSSSAVRVMIKIDPNKLDRSLLHLPRELHGASALKGEPVWTRMRVPYLEAIY